GPPPPATLPTSVIPGALVDLDRPDPCWIIPDPDAPGRRDWPDKLAPAMTGTIFAIGPTVPPTDAALSLRVATQAMELGRRGALAADHYIRCADHLPTLLLTHDQDLLDLMTRQLYTPLA